MECEVPQVNSEASFEEIKSDWKTQNYWVRFFMRPCCPPPGNKTAQDMINRLKADIDARADMSTSERDALKAIADERLEWYLKLPVRHTA